MTFMGVKALKAKFGDAECIVQVRVFTKMRSMVEVEGPVSEADATLILKHAMGEPVKETEG